MQRPSALLQTDTPVRIESRALGTLAFIRASIESAGSMDVPGMAGIVMGLVGLLASILVATPRLAPHWLGIWLSAAAVALLFGGILVARQVALQGRPGFLGPVRRFVLCLCPALGAGAVLTGVLWDVGAIGVIPGAWLLLYGCAVISASTVINAAVSRLVSIMGALFVILGCAAFALPAIAHTAMLGLGFGGLHLLFGLLIGRHSHGR
jgi:hypothetical protein